MIRQIADRVIVFDAEWVPDPETGRRVHRLPASASDAEIREAMWAAAGAKPENPRPFLKLILCRVVSIAALIRQARDGLPPTLKLHSVPNAVEPALPESAIIERFLEGGLGDQDAQLVGFNSSNSDLSILVQRGIAHGLRAPGFSRRPEKPWEGRDYFSRHGDWHIDLMSILGSGRDWPSLDQMALAAGIPGKIDLSGEQVLDLWLAGDVRRIVEYNQCDALTTYLLWLRVVHFAGLLTHEQYAAEQAELERLLEKKAEEEDGRHLRTYLQQWRVLRGAS